MKYNTEQSAGCIQRAYYGQTKPTSARQPERCKTTDNSSCTGDITDILSKCIQNKTRLPSFWDNGDGTITDHATDLMWEKKPAPETYLYYEASNHAKNLDTGGYSDWRIPTIKELYSIADYRCEIVPGMINAPYIDTRHFDLISLPGVDASSGSYWSCTEYLAGPAIGMDLEGILGFNFIRGCLEVYPAKPAQGISETPECMTKCLRCVRDDKTRL